MAFKRKFRKSRKFKARKRPYGKRSRLFPGTRRPRQPSTMVSRGLAQPDRAIVHLRYTYQAHQAPASTTSSLQYLINSLHHCNYTAGNGGAMGTDFWKIGYNAYRVFSASWKVYVCSNLATNSPSITTVVYPIIGTGVASSQETASESRYAITKMAQVGGRSMTFKGRMSLPRLFGQTRVQYMSEDANTAIFGQQPGNIAMLNVYTASVDGATNVSYDIRVEIIYNCELLDRLNQATSTGN